MSARDDDVYIVGAARTVFGRYDGEDNELAEQAKAEGAAAQGGTATPAAAPAGGAP